MTKQKANSEVRKAEVMQRLQSLSPKAQIAILLVAKERKFELLAKQTQSQRPERSLNPLGENTQSKQAIADTTCAKDAKRNIGTDNASDFNQSDSLRLETLLTLSELELLRKLKKSNEPFYYSSC